MRGHVNEVNIIGTVCRNPVPTLTPKEELFTTFALVTELEFKTTKGKTVREVDYHEVIVWGLLANLCAKNLVTGRLIYLRGRQHTQTVQDQQSGRSYKTSEVIGVKSNSWTVGRKSRIIS